LQEQWAVFGEVFGQFEHGNLDFFWESAPRIGLAIKFLCQVTSQADLAVG
jgi:hypothetical protein